MRISDAARYLVASALVLVTVVGCVQAPGAAGATSAQPVAMTPSAGPASADPSGLAEAAPDIKEVLASRGYECLRVAFITRKKLDEAAISALMERASALGGAGGWAIPGAGPRDTGQAWIGSVEGAAKAMGAELAVTGEDPWIIVEDGGLVAHQLVSIALPDGRQAWVLDDSIRPVKCP